ncbi:hypothetical protein [Natronorubrum texcoconense]|uniref:CHAT domain-containing protein n=1 Tax=Natronorubrum texcoconense TaxID=1095776 RepID=A0A1G9BRZ1_9EURY|nr:hypothetical protein [Natronorubrum texcoconense]SDK42207.1 hypothetical protein SAMN04515672_3065 [Natronorubrum texcoconense]
MKPKFESNQDGIEIIDPIERYRDRLITHEPVTPQSVDENQVAYPIGAAVEVTTDRISLSEVNSVYVRGKDKSITTEVQPDERVVLSQNKHTLDVSSSIKVYLVLDSSVEIYSDRNKTHIELDKHTNVIIGARSYHTRPARTIETTTAPSDLMKAISAFGSALKTTAAERSFPTARGHPPAIEIGEELSIPEEIKRPKTNIKLAVPPTLKHIFTITPLAYYLGAKVVPKAKPQLITDSGFSYSLDSKEEFETTVERLLKHVFFLDCIVRTEGITPLPLHEREMIESNLPFDPSELYEQSLSEQLETYLESPFSLTKVFLPEWRLKVQLENTPEHIPFLPFIANNLSIVDVQEKTSQSTNQTIKQFWSSTGGSKFESPTPISAYTNSITQTPTEEPIRIEVVCNDPDMNSELTSVYSAYSERDDFPIDVTVHHRLTTADLKKVLVRESDFVHYIGHIDSNGVRCSDGRLNVATLKSVNAKSFFLNACQSNNQGIQLIKAGSIGGVVTSSDVQNSDAVHAGSVIARLLNQGFSLYGAIDILRKVTKIGHQYHVVGDGLSIIAQPNNGAPNMCSITKQHGDLIIDIHEYVSIPNMDIGGVFYPYIESVETYHLVPKKFGPLSVTKPELVEFLELENIPVLMNGELRWSDEISINEL